MATKKNDSDGLTFIVVPDGGGNVRRIRLSRNGVRFLVVAMIGLFFGASLLLMGYIGAKFDNTHLAHQKSQTKTANAKLLEENAYHQAQLDALYAKVRGIDKKLEKMKDLDRAIRRITHLEVGDGDMPDVGMGGELDTLAMTGSGQLEMKTIFSTLNKSLDRMNKRSERQFDSMQSLRDQLSVHEGSLASIPSIWPVRGWISSEFGYRISPFTGERAIHHGIDIATPEGMPIIAPATGIVTYVGRQGGYGNTVEVRHGAGLKTVYGHLQVSLVSVGQKVQRGQRIALVGNTGKSTGPHLHYEIQVGDVPVNPRRYIIQ